MLSLIGYNYAAKNYARMVKVIKTTFLYTMVVAVLTTLFLFFCAAPVSRSFIKDQETVTYGQHFLRVLCLICPCLLYTSHAEIFAHDAAYAVTRNTVADLGGNRKADFQIPGAQVHHRHVSR